MKHVPNILTTIRIFLVFIYLSVFYSGHEYALPIALTIFFIAGVTDVVDGYIARKYQVISRFGQVMDPLADKMMQVTVLITLSLEHYIEYWIVYIILAKELFMILSGLVLYFSKTKIVIPSNKFGKMTTVMIYLSILLSVVEFKYINHVFSLVILLSLVTLLQYILIGLGKLKAYFKHKRVIEALDQRTQELNQIE